MAQADLDGTIAALKGGLTSLPAEAAVANIESWQQQLEGTPASKTLGELKAALSGQTGGKSIGALLSELGTQTSSAAGGASGDAATKLKQLGEALSQAGTSLS